MKIWVVTSCLSPSENWVCGVYSSKERADEVAIMESTSGHKDYLVEEWNLDDGETDDLQTDIFVRGNRVPVIPREYVT